MQGYRIPVTENKPNVSFAPMESTLCTPAFFSIPEDEDRLDGNDSPGLSVGGQHHIFKPKHKAYSGSFFHTMISYRGEAQGDGEFSFCDASSRMVCAVILRRSRNDCNHQCCTKIVLRNVDFIRCMITDGHPTILQAVTASHCNCTTV